MSKINILSIAVFLLVAGIGAEAAAFCGFYVGPKQGLYNDATQVVLMRKGVHTVLSMRPDYEGPVDNFAMVVPVPQVLQKEDVNTLTAQPFETIDRLSMPRLVEYHEQDPCAHHRPQKRYPSRSMAKGGAMPLSKVESAVKEKVRVKAQFTKGEYEIVILDADESAALEAWLNQNGYKQPKGSAKALAPYIQEGFYFFAAKVNAQKVTFAEDGTPRAAGSALASGGDAGMTDAPASQANTGGGTSAAPIQV